MAKGLSWRSIDKSRKCLEKKLFGHSNMIVFDTETTGLADPENGIQEVDIKIIQFSAILYDIERDSSGLITNLRQLDKFDMYLNPQELLSDIVIETTGITDRMLLGAETEDKAAWKIYQFMSRSDLWIGYNVGYDLKRLKGMSQRTGYPYKQAKDVIDVLPMARDIISLDEIRAYTTKTGKKKLYRLENITPYLFPDFEVKFHDSLEDVRSTGKCFAELYNRYQQLDPDKMKTGEEKLSISSIKFTLNYHSPLKSKKIVLYTPNGLSGIQWDMYYGYWTCDSKKGSDKLFKAVNLQDVEEKVLFIAKTRLHSTAVTMDDLANEMFRNFSKSPEGKRLNKMSREDKKERDKAKKEEESMQKSMDASMEEDMDICIE